MDEQKLRANLGAMDIALNCYESTDSTNLRAKEWARRGGELPAAFLADAQTAGRGRLGVARTWRAGNSGRGRKSDHKQAAEQKKPQSDHRHKCMRGTGPL